MNTNIPNNLMDNVEKKLRKHIKAKRKRNYIYKAAVIASLVILPTSTFAYAKFNNSIPYAQEINLARENKNITEINKTFRCNKVELQIKELVADDTGIEVIYDVSDPKYSVSSLSFDEKDNKLFSSWGSFLPNSSLNSKEKAFYIIMDNNAANYMHNNPVTIKINKLKINEGEKSNNVFHKISSLFNKNNNLEVNWTLKMQLPMQQVKVIPVNKEYSLDIGVLKINSLKVGVLKSIFDYSFIPNDKKIKRIEPLFSIRLDNEYTLVNSGFSINTTLACGKQEFKSIYYNNVNDLGIKLIGVHSYYDISNSNVYKVDKNNLPMEFDYNGEKFKITSMKQKGETTEYTVDYDKTNRIYSDLYLTFIGATETGVSFNNGNIQYRDQATRDAIYSSLAKKIPNLKDIKSQIINWRKGSISEKITTKPGTTEFKIDTVVKDQLYDVDEIKIKY